VSEVAVEVVDGVATVTLNAPERRNALSAEMVAEVVATFDQLEDDSDARAVIVTGAPPSFCAGAVLADLSGADAQHLRVIYQAFTRVARSTLPTIAAVNGPAVGAGCNLALACDVRVAATSARFVARFVELGLFPGGGHTWMLSRLAGTQAAFALDVFGDTLTGAEAARVGLAWRCVDDEGLMDEATRLAAFAAQAPPELIARLTGTIRDMPAVATHDEALERELTHQVWSASQPYAVERLAAMQARINRR
jgi:enoyl-CoA hydratase